MTVARRCPAKNHGATFCMGQQVLTSWRNHQNNNPPTHQVPLRKAYVTKWPPVFKINVGLLVVVRRGAVHCVGKQAAPTHRKRPTKPSAVTCRKTRQIRGFALSCAATLPPMKHPFGSHLSASMCQSGWGLKYKRAAACFTWLHKRPNGVGVDPQKRCFFGTQALRCCCSHVNSDGSWLPQVSRAPCKSEIHAALTW